MHYAFENNGYMLIDQIKKNAVARTRIVSAIQDLIDFDVIGALLQICSKRTRPGPASKNPIEDAALDGVYREGFIAGVEALLTLPQTLLQEVAKQDIPKAPDFGAANTVLKNSLDDVEKARRAQITIKG